MACSKLALILFIRSLTPTALDRRFALGLGTFVVLWTIAGVFTAAFQCSVPDTWDYLHGKCFHLVRVALTIPYRKILTQLPGCLVELPRNHQHPVRSWHSRTGIVGHLTNPSKLSQKGCPSQCIPATSHVSFCESSLRSKTSS